MKSTLFSLSVLTIAFFVSTAAFAQKKEATPKKQKDKILVNRTYAVDFSETGSKKPVNEPDEMSFKSGKLNSKFMLTKHKFAPGEYTIVSVDSTEKYVEISFSSESKNGDGETLKLDGNVTDDAIEGTAVITGRNGKTVTEYTFSGNTVKYSAQIDERTGQVPGGIRRKLDARHRSG